MDDIGGRIDGGMVARDMGEKDVKGAFLSLAKSLRRVPHVSGRQSVP
jgi:hypothetical protein